MYGERLMERNRGSRVGDLAARGLGAGMGVGEVCEACVVWQIMNY